MKRMVQAAVALLVVGGGGMQAMANGSTRHGLFWRVPVGERTVVVSTTVVRDGECVRRTRTVAVRHRVGTILHYSSRPPVVAESSSWNELPPAVGEQVEIPVVGGRKTVTVWRSVRTTPTVIGEGPTEPGPTVAPAYPNWWVDYNNPYR